MIYPPKLNSNPVAKRQSLLDPPEAWCAILAFVGITALGLLSRFSSPLQIVFPAGAIGVALFLFTRHPILYLGFNWWIWFFSPFVSRLVEYQNGWSDNGLRLIILAPYLVASISIISLLNYLPRLPKMGGMAFVLAFSSIVYATGVALVKNNSVVDVGQDVLSWGTGIFLGAHIFINWRQYPAIRRNTQRAFTWSILIMGGYGIYQYIVAPAWDTFWLRNAEDLQYCCGWPAPFELRVWSTLNYPFTFAYAIMAGLLMLLSIRGALVIPSTVLGFLSFLLSNVRMAWGGWFLGVLTLVSTLKESLQIRLLAIITAILLVMVPLVMMSTFSQEIVARFSTFENIGEDESYNERVRIYSEVFESIVYDPMGRGMGGKKIIDAGALDVLGTLGWIGLIPFLSGLVIMGLQLSSLKIARSDPFANACRSIVVSILVALPATNTLLLLPGVMLWFFYGAAIAAQKYALHASPSRLQAPELHP